MMATKREITRNEIMPMALYASERRARRAKLVDVKRQRTSRSRCSMTSVSQREVIQHQGQIGSK